MKEFALQYIDDDGNIRIAYIRAATKDEAVDKFRKGQR